MSTTAPPEAASAHVSRERVIELNEAAWGYWRWHASQRDAWTANYLRHRGLPRVTAGLAPQGWTRMVKALGTRGVDDAELLGAGLARRSTSGTLIDTFRDRLVLPIRDDAGAIIGFTARRNPALDNGDDRNPKYLNTTTTAAFDKSRVLYGLDPTAVASLRSGDGRAVIVEGALDAEAVRTLAGPWVPVAACGTAITANHIQALAKTHHRALNNAVLALDPDPAGRAGARRVWDLVPPWAACDIYCARLRDDPAQMIQDGRGDDLKRLLDTAPRYTEVLVDDHLSHLPPTFMEQRNALVQLANAVGRLDSYTLGELAERLGAGYNADPEAELNLPTAVAALMDAHDRPEQWYPRRTSSDRSAARDVGPAPPAARTSASRRWSSDAVER